MTKEEIINKYFYKSNFFGNRCCKYNKCYPFHKWRINKKGQLQLDQGNFLKIPHGRYFIIF